MPEQGAELSDQGRQNLWTLAFGSLGAEAVGGALRKLDFTGLPMT